MYPRTIFLLLALLCIFVNAGVASEPGRTRLIGTWRWVKVDDHAVDLPFYLRFYADGPAASWPAPKEWSDARGVSRGRYSLAYGRLTLETGAGKLNPKTRIRFEADELRFTTDEGQVLTYRRVLPTLKPGLLENGKKAGFLKDPS